MAPLTGVVAVSASRSNRNRQFSLGPLPEADRLVFKALQTYSDGDVVRWIEEPTGGTEPDHPAPVLKLSKANAAPAPADDAADDAAVDENESGTGLGIAGILLGLAGLVAGLLACRKAAAPTT